MSFIVKKAFGKVAGKQAEAYEPPNPYYQYETTPDGKKKRSKRPLPEGLTKEEGKLLMKVRRRAHYLDKGFSICGFRFGWTFFIALIPVLGDIVTALLGYNLVTKQTKKADIPGSLLSRMQLNTLIAAGVGFIPLVGDVIMAVIKPNTRNALLFEEWLVEKTKTRPLGSAGTSNGDVEAQRVLDRANDGSWSARTGGNDAFHVQSGAPTGIDRPAPAVPGRAVQQNGRTVR